MDDLTATLDNFDSYLDSILQGRKELQIDVKSLSKISKLSRTLGSQSTIMPHCDLNRNLLVQDSKGITQLSTFASPSDQLSIKANVSTGDLLGLAKTVFEDISVMYA